MRDISSQEEKRGFTFVELLLVAAMLTVLGLTLYATFTNGINFWQRISEDQPAEEIMLFFEKFSQDVRNSFKYSGISFKGKSDEISFPAFGEFQWNDGKREGVGRRSYFFDRSSNSLKTKHSNYSEVYKEKFGYERQLVKDIAHLSFEYYSYDQAEEKFFWASSWQEVDQDEKFGIVEEQRIPLAVRVEIEIKQGRSTRQFQKTVFIPAAYRMSFVKE